MGQLHQGLAKPKRGVLVPAVTVRETKDLAQTKTKHICAVKNSITTLSAHVLHLSEIPPENSAAFL